MILKHISQICSVLNKFPITVTAIEAGMVGPWGEMHSSILANSSTISKIIGKFLNNTSKIPILVRTPKMIYDYLEISIQDIDNYNIQSNSKAYRLGLFNDGFLASESDLGTYTDREKDIEFISKQTEHLPFGGEVTGTTSNLHDIDKCLPEMFKLNLSYLNYEWNDEIVTTKWQNQLYDENAGNDSLYYGKTAYNYIKDHMGYRFVLKNSTFTYSGLYDNLKISLKIDNVGFGNLNKSKNMIAYFVREDGVVEKVALVGSFNGENEITFNINISTLTGNYAVFLAINSLQNGNFCYPIRFANDLWNNSLKANHIGNIIIK